MVVNLDSHCTDKVGVSLVKCPAFETRPQFPALAQFLGGSTFDTKAAMREFYLKSSRLFALYLRPILLTVPFVFYKEDSEIMELIDLMKAHYGSGKSPSTFKLPQDLKDNILNSSHKCTSHDTSYFHSR